VCFRPGVIGGDVIWHVVEYEPHTPVRQSCLGGGQSIGAAEGGVDCVTQVRTPAPPGDTVPVRLLQPQLLHTNHGQHAHFDKQHTANTPRRSCGASRWFYHHARHRGGGASAWTGEFRPLSLIEQDNDGTTGLIRPRRRQSNTRRTPVVNEYFTRVAATGHRPERVGTAPKLPPPSCTQAAHRRSDRFGANLNTDGRPSKRETSFVSATAGPRSPPAGRS
jgi:hypothetical protein